MERNCNICSAEAFPSNPVTSKCFRLPGPCRLVTEIPWRTKFFVVHLPKPIGIILMHSHRRAMVVLAVVMFYWTVSGQRGQGRRLNSQIWPVSQTLAAHRLHVAALARSDSVAGKSVRGRCSFRPFEMFFPRGLPINRLQSPQALDAVPCPTGRGGSPFPRCGKWKKGGVGVPFLEEG